MTLIVLPSLIQGSDAWLEQRRGMVTASVVGRLITTKTRYAIDYYCTHCGAGVGAPCVSLSKGAASGLPIKTIHEPRVAASQLDPTPPPLTVASNDYSRALTAELVAERITGWTDPQYVSDDMLRGHEDEPRAIAKYEEWRKVTVDTDGFMIREVTVDDRTFRIGYSPDGLVGDDGLVEVKAPRAKRHLQTILSGQVPAEHMAQLQCGLLVSGRKWVDYLSYCGGMPMWPCRVEPDPRWHDAILAAVANFEETADEMVAAYEKATESLPATERVIELEMVI